MNNNESKVEEVNEEKDVVEESVSEMENEEQNEEVVEESQNEDEKDIKLKQLEESLQETNNRLLRAQADFDNFRRRSKQEREASEKYRSQNLLNDLLPVLDNFQRALAVETNDGNSNSFIQGMEMVYRQLLDAMKKEGLEEIEAEGKEFDPNYHQAVMQVEDDNYESNIVVEELQKGYVLKDRVLRPSMVKVNQ